MTPLALILMLSLSAGCVLAGRVLFHYFQLESYQHPGYFRTLRRNVLKSFLPGTIEAIVWALSLLLFAVLIPEDNDWLPVICTSAAVLVCGVLLYRLSRDHHAKKQFRFTPRMKRLYAVSFFVFAGILIALRFCVPAGEPAVSAVLFMLFPLFLPLWVALSGLVAWPIEKAISEMYFGTRSGSSGSGRTSSESALPVPGEKPASSSFLERFSAKNTTHLSPRPVSIPRWVSPGSSVPRWNPATGYSLRKWVPAM